MNFVSYAQNFEDVMLWRALKHVKNGYYIDIGAQDPHIDSVSLAFYEHGWRGLHVEPTRQYSEKLRAARPDETVLQVAVGSAAGMLTFYEFADTGLSTAEPEIALRHQKDGYQFNKTLVSVVSMDELLDQVQVQDVHWLKIDVEGLEKSVLESWNGSGMLPWILVIESTRPLTQDESHHDWEALLLKKGYVFAYFDGLNRFYIAPDHPELAQSFGTPPNYFDSFVLALNQPFCKLAATNVHLAESEVQLSQSHAQQAQANATHAEAKLRETEQRAQLAETQVQLVQTQVQLAQSEAQHAESKAQHAESKAQQAESKAQQAESKAQQAESKAQHAESKAQHAESKAQQAESKAQQAESKAQQAESQAQQAESQAQQAESKAQQASMVTSQLQGYISAVHVSTSWRITSPIRFIGRKGRSLTSAIRDGRIKSGLKRRLKIGLRYAGGWILERPWLKKSALKLIKRVPGLHKRLHQFFNPASALQPHSARLAGSSVERAGSPLSPSAARILSDLKQALQNKEK